MLTKSFPLLESGDGSNGNDGKGAKTGAGGLDALLSE